MGLFRSRKFLLALCAVAVPVLNKVLGLGLVAVEIGAAVSGLCVAIWGVAVEDAALKGNPNHTEPAEQ